MIQKSILFMAVLAIFLVGCQKEENAKLGNEPITNVFETGYAIHPENKFSDKEKPSNSKFPIKKPSSVEIIDQWGSFKTHETMKVRKHDGTNYQEWMMVDLETDVFDYKYWNADYGNFYTWTEGGVNPFPLKYNYDNAYDYLAYDADYNPIIGFHIPNLDDLMTLGATLGNTNKISDFLELKETGLMRHYGTPTEPDGAFTRIDDPTNFNGELVYTTMWIDLRQDGDAYFYDNNPGCGIYLWCVKSMYDNDIQFFHTNIPNLRTRIRLVRDLDPSEW